MDDLGQILPTRYQSSRGVLDIATMAYPHVANAIAKLEREGRSQEPVFAALVARKTTLDAEQLLAQEAAPVAEAIEGHNGAPEHTPFDEIKGELEDLRIEAGNWCDGAEIENQAQADEVGRLLEKVRVATAKAEKARVSEKKPLDDAAQEIQDRYNALIGRTKKLIGVAPRMEDAIKAALAVWLRKVADKQDAERREAAAKAEEARQQAEQSIASTHQTADIEERDAALRDVDVARQAAIDLAAANRAKAQVHGETRAIGLRTVYRAEIDSLKDALAHYWRDRPESFLELVEQFAKDDIRAGKRSGIPGITIHADQVV